MNKKALALIAVLVLLIAAFIAISKLRTPNAPAEPVSTAAPEPSAEPTAEPTPEPTAEPAPESAPSESAPDTASIEAVPNENGGVDVPLDQVLDYIEVTYGKEALDIAQEALDYEVASFESMQQALATFPPDYMERVIKEAWPDFIQSKINAAEMQKLSDAHDGAAEVRAHAANH